MINEILIMPSENYSNHFKYHLKQRRLAQDLPEI